MALGVPILKHIRVYSEKLAEIRQDKILHELIPQVEHG